MNIDLVSQSWSKLKSRFHAHDVGFYETPINDEISQAAASQELAQSLLARGIFTDCLFLGIGGSSLGPVSLLSALQERTHDKVRIHVMENPDPVEWKSTLARLQPESTLVCAVTKSGTTFETLAQFLLALDWLGRERWKSHVVAITDPSKGDLKKFATEEGIPTLHIHPSLGGRFSIFSPVGLFPAALAGLNIANFLQGAKQVRDQMEKVPIEKNPIFILGHDLIRHYPSRSIHVCMPYSTRLRLIGDWFVQLWGESLGKDGKGFTPLAACGSIDQHSILQLLRDGPDDKITLFITLDEVPDEVRIPEARVGDIYAKYPAFKLLQGHSLQDLLNIEYRATSLVLTKQGRPNATLKVGSLDERSLGALYFSLSVLTAFTGTLWEVEPFDQPGVEEAKVYIRQSLGEADRARRAQRMAEEDTNTPVARLRGTRENKD